MNPPRTGMRLICLLAAWLPAGLAMAEDVSFDAADSLSRVALGLVGVMVLIFGLAWAVRRFSFLNVLQRDADSPIRAVGQISVGTNERIMLIEVDGRRLLIGVTPHQITRLDPFDGIEAGAGKDFAAHLQASREARK